jgi:DNA-binding NtrC family response regulator
MAAVRALVDAVAATDDPVLIRGETGTGKTTVARLIHARSCGPAATIVTLACPALLREPTSFDCLLSAAAGGSLLLDEVAEMSLSDQDAFLAALRRARAARAGGREVRCLATTRADLDALSRQGRFRPELHAALAVARVELPPLRTRLADLPELIGAFFEKAEARGLLPAGRRLTLTPRALSELASHTWLGNVLELENVLERVVIATSAEVIDEDVVRGALTNRAAKPAGR